MNHTKQWLENTVINLKNQRNASRCHGQAAVASILNCDIRYFQGLLNRREYEGGLQ